ncbi:MAG TPA: MBG domain-containing protein, partial [Verrucomicrobiae bacterium]|nr:MBG domain-containing protein [Verrucomicrobiae bacterium]
ATINTGANSLNAGSYSDTVTFTNTTNGIGNTTRSVGLTVAPVQVAVTLGNLNQTYDGNPKPISVTTSPAGITHSVAYTPSGVPVNAGTYPVTATVTAPNRTGSASGSLVIAKAGQSITFASLNPLGDDQPPFDPGATASSGLPVSYSSSNTEVATVSGTTVTIVGPGTTEITASQAGDSNREAAAPVKRTLTVFQTNVAEAVIYEPFDDSDPTLTGNTAGRGISGTWFGNAAVTAGTLGFGSLPLGSSGKATISDQNGFASVGPTLTNSGLLDDGATLWFSVIVETGGDIATNGDLGFALGTDPTTSGNSLPIANGGTALGFTFKDNQLRASRWTSTLTRSGTNSNNGASPAAKYLVVGRITWGATSDLIEIYMPATDLGIGAVVSSFSADVAQSLFDTVSFSSKAATPAHHFDEIRFGASYESVIGIGVPGTVNHFAISSIPSPQTVDTPISGITVTARDSSNATVTGFSGTVTFGGTGGFTGTSASFTAGVLSGVSVTPQVAGSDLTLT